MKSFALKYACVFFSMFFSVFAHAKFEAVKFPTSDGVKLNARIYQPSKKKAQLPGILIVEGFGKSHSDKEPDTSPFFQLAQVLSDDGFSVMVFSKRGSGSNSKNGSWAKSSFWIDNQDAQSAFDYLKSYKGVDKDRMYLFGQSIGCLQSSILAQKNAVKGLIVFAGGYQNFLNILEEQNLGILEMMGKSPDEAKKDIAPMMHAYSDIKAGKLDCEKYKSLCRVEDGAMIVDDSQEKYMAEVFKIEPLEELGKVTAPVLVLQGTSDFVVMPKEFERAKKAYESKKNFTFQLLDGVDHFMADQPTKIDSLKSMDKIKKTKSMPPLSLKLSNAAKVWLRKFQVKSI